MKTLFLRFILIASCLFTICRSTKGTNSNEDIRPLPGEIISSQKGTTTDTQSGKVAGYIVDGVYTYKGIPYAKAERFMEPQVPDCWEGIKGCHIYGPTCPQEKRPLIKQMNDDDSFAFQRNDGYSDEDCLRLNIWTKGLNDGKKRPIMVWIHGGGYAYGSCHEMPAYDGTNLAEKGDVVVVSLNHRLNVLGYLDLSAYGEKYAHSGNAGILDLIAALQWIQKNIRNFGGDPDNVTIFGQSGGGGKVSTLLSTPYAKGLFHKAIIQSGSQLRTMEQKYSHKIASIVLKELGLQPYQVDSLQRVPYEQLFNAGIKAVETTRIEAEQEGFDCFIFGLSPVVDGDVLPTQPFDKQAPEVSRDIPMMIGSTLNEFCKASYVPFFRNLSEEKVMEQINQKFGSRSNDYLQAFAKAYPNYKPQDLIDIDNRFRVFATKQAALKAKQEGAAVYTYLFTWQSPAMDGIYRAYHCMEIPFVFNNVVLQASMTGGGREARVLADKMSRAWINFAHTGNPNAEGLPLWIPYTEKEATMIFDNQCEVKYGFDRELTNILGDFLPLPF